MNIICPHCGALHWRDEETDKHDFSSCCSAGKTVLPPLPDPPPQLRELYVGQSPQAKEFRNNIVQYNRAFAFTSLGVDQDFSVNKGSGPPVFRIHGELKHWSGTLLPVNGRTPSYAQLYFYDPQIAVNFRTSNNPQQRRDTMALLEEVLRANNPYVRIYLHAYEILQHYDAPEYSVKICVAPGAKNHHNNDIPTADEVAVILPGNHSVAGDNRDIILSLRPRPGHSQSDNTSQESLGLQRIHEGHSAYAPLQYVLLFPYGEPGWNWDMTLTDGSRMTLRQFSCYRLHDRQHEFSTILRSGRLLQHYIVDMFAAIDQSRLRWYYLNQPQFRLSHLQGMEDAINRQDDQNDLAHLGQRIILPSSYQGGPRDMHQRFQDSMAIAHFFKKIDIFLTITTNPNWPEIRQELLPGQQPYERPDLIARVFKMKKDALLHLITQKGIFGKSVAHIYSIEFQKRGLPHAHILIFLAPDDQLSSPEAIDEVIWARWPDPETQPHLFNLVKKHMVHGPCGPQHPDAPCMVNGKCRFGFPKPFQEYTTLTQDGYPLYYRPNDGRAYDVNGFMADNRWIATFNPFCLEFLEGHVNIECAWCFWTTKYLTKYVKKGGDTGTLRLTDENNEIQQYINGRYFSAAEGAWRIFGFDMHGQQPSVMRLPIHLPEDQAVVFNAQDDPQHVIAQGRQSETALTAFFTANNNQGEIGMEARKHTYQEFPQYFTLKTHGNHKEWCLRKQRPSLGRMVYVSPTAGERFYLRTLLSVVRGPQSFDDLLCVDGQRYTSFHDACVAHGLLEDDGEWNMCLEEASEMRTGSSLRHLFATLLMFSNPAFPDQLWERFRHSICDDLPYRLRNMGFVSNSEEDIYDFGLYLLNNILKDSGRSLNEFRMPQPTRDWEALTQNHLIAEQLHYDQQSEQDAAHQQIKTLNPDQEQAFTEIWDSIINHKGRSFFIDGFGGTGKTYLYQTLCHAIRGQGLIVLCVASTGLAALLLPGGRTAHSTFKIPISTLNEDSICNIPKESQRAQLLRHTDAIIYDECLMNNKMCFEALDRTLRDLRDIPNKVYGGITVVHGGDFQQILPVITKGTRAEIVNACIQRSYLWECMKVIKLRQNMRLGRSPEEDHFAAWLLDIGHGRNMDECGRVELPASIVSSDFDHFIQEMYGDVFTLPAPPHPQYFLERAILAPRNCDTKSINDVVLDGMPGDETVYLSADNIIKEDGDVNESSANVPVEYLHSLEPSTLPPAMLKVKIGCPLILLRNLDPSKGLCNGTRMVLLRAQRRVLEVRILGGDHDGDIALIPRISLIPSAEEGLTFQFKRRQFPVKLAFAMTINKAEGQSLHTVGIDLRVPVFSHGQLYVALSRATSSKRVRVLLPENAENKTQNVVYPEVLLD